MRVPSPHPWLLLGLLPLSSPALAWDPDAGVIVPFTRHAPVTVTSNPDDAPNTVDGNTSTFWQSGACLPTGFLERADLNLLFDACSLGACENSGSSDDPSYATDADVYTSCRLSVGAESAWFQACLPAEGPLIEVAVRGTFEGVATVELVGSTGTVLLGTLDSSDDRALVHFPAPDGEWLSVLLSSSDDMSVTELAARELGCFEQAIVDMGDIREIGLVRSRHLSASHVTSSTLLSSLDGVEWTERSSLDPEASATVEIRFDSPFSARYLSVRHQVEDVDWAKVYLWELEAYDADGRWGPAPAPAESAVSMADLLGVNGIWGWGTGAYSDAWGAQGPGRYSTAVRHARNYHNLSWDVTDPDHVPDYEAMARGEGTEAQSWLNWDTEYEAWVLGGLEVHTAIQFLDSSMPESVWDDPFEAGRGYGQAFAAHFGPSKGNALIRGMEVGNEPWDYSAEFYQQVLLGMATGARAADPAMQVLPAAFQADDPYAEATDGSSGNYVGARVPEEAASLLDALNVHVYSFHTPPDGERVALPPEDPDSSMHGLFNMVRWRDANLPDLPIWVTEWGWDSDGAGESCTDGECVSDRAASVYAVRAALFFARMGVQRADWFFFANLDGCTTLFCRSGLVSSSSSGFLEKGAFRALQALVLRSGDARFLDVVEEDDSSRVYLLGDASGPTHVVAWRPAPGDDETVTTIVLDLALRPIQAWHLSGESATGEDADIPAFSEGTWETDISAVPLLVRVEPWSPDDTGDTEDPDTESADDSGTDDSTPDSGAPSKDDPTGTCGCAQGGQTPALSLLALLLIPLARRRASLSAPLVPSRGP